MPTIPLAERARPGDSFSIKHTFDAAAIADFARRTGDSNPVHADPQAGAASRFGKRIASAGHIVSLMIAPAASWLADRGTSFSLGCSFRFTAAVLEGDVIETVWTVTSTLYKESLRGLIVVLEGSATNAKGLACARGRLEMLLQD